MEDGNNIHVTAKSKGSDGEDIAALYLENKKYKIIKRNFHFGRSGEIDIVARDGKTLVFIEVKCRYSHKFGHPLESINYKKQQNLRKVAEGYLFVNKISDCECRFDVIAIDYTFDKNNPEITHIVNAF